MDSQQALLLDIERDSQYDDDPESSSDSIEMTGLEDVPVTPRRPMHGASVYHPDDHHSDDDSDGEDAGDQALLGSHMRTRGRERSLERHPNTFSQVKRIVLEVCFSQHKLVLCSPALDSTYALSDNGGPTAHRRDPGHRVGEVPPASSCMQL